MNISQITNENAEDLNIGDPVIVTGNVQFKGKTGDIVDFGKDKRFVIVNLYNFGKHSFHSSDVSYNNYAESGDEQERLSQFEESKTGTKFVGKWKGTDSADKAKQRLVGEAKSLQSKFEKHLKKHGYDVNEKAKYWEQKIKDIDAQIAAWDADMKRRKEGVSEGSETAADIGKQIEFHKQGQAAAQYKGAMNKTHAAKIRELTAKLDAMKKQGVAEGYMDGPEYGGAYVNGRSDDARMTAKLTRQAKAAAKKAGKTFNTSAEYRKWHRKQKERQGVAEGRRALPTKSGVYPVTWFERRGEKTGYSYYHQPHKNWLMMSNTPEGATATAKKFLAALKQPGDQRGSYVSNYQGNDVQWSTPTEQGVAEGLGKNIKRGLQGWYADATDINGEKMTPKDVVRRNKNYDDETLQKIHKAVNGPGPGFPFSNSKTKHSPADLQKRVLDREMKKRGLGEQGVAEGSDNADIDRQMARFTNRANREKTLATNMANQTKKDLGWDAKKKQDSTMDPNDVCNPSRSSWIGLDEQGVAEGSDLGTEVDTKGRTRAEWTKQVHAKYPKALVAHQEDGNSWAVIPQPGAPDAKKVRWIKDEGMFEQSVAEDEGLASYYYERLAQKVFDLDPTLSTQGRANKLVKVGHEIAVKDLGYKRANWEFYYNEDFTSDFVSAYSELQRGQQGVAEAGVNTAGARAGLSKLAKLNSMSPEERKAYDQKQEEQSRKRAEARREKERKKQAAKAEWVAYRKAHEQGVAEGRDNPLQDIDPNGWHLIQGDKPIAINFPDEHRAKSFHSGHGYGRETKILPGSQVRLNAYLKYNPGVINWPEYSKGVAEGSEQRVKIISGPSMYVGKTGVLGTPQAHHAKPGYVLVNLDHAAGSILLPKEAVKLQGVAEDSKEEFAKQDTLANLHKLGQQGKSNVGTDVYKKAALKYKTKGVIARDKEQGVAEGEYDPSYDSEYRPYQKPDQDPDAWKQQRDLEEPSTPTTVTIRDQEGNVVLQFPSTGGYYGDVRTAKAKGFDTESGDYDIKWQKNEDAMMSENAGVTSEQVASAIVRRIIFKHKDAISAFGPEAIMAAAREVGEYFAGSDDLGTSDIGIATKYTLEKLDQMSQGNLQETASGGASSAGSIATTPAGGSGKNVGSLFGGTYKQKRTKKSPGTK